MYMYSDLWMCYGLISIFSCVRLCMVVCIRVLISVVWFSLYLLMSHVVVLCWVLCFIKSLNHFFGGVGSHYPIFLFLVMFPTRLSFFPRYSGFFFPPLCILTPITLTEVGEFLWDTVPWFLLTKTYRLINCLSGYFCVLVFQFGPPFLARLSVFLIVFPFLVDWFFFPPE